MFSSILQRRWCPHYWWHQVLYELASCHYSPLLTLTTHPSVMVFTIWGNIGSPNHYVSQMVNCFTNMLGMSFKTYPTIGSTILMYTYLCTYLGSSLSWFYTKVFSSHVPKPKMTNENNGMWHIIDYPNLDMSTNWIEK
jgi:predicted DNA-binding transcriptional regulator AlpA